MSAIKGSKELNKEAAEADGEPLALETESITPEDGTDVESDAGKLRQLLGVLKKVVGVKDLANLRLSLPANLMEPQGNLEYWHYLDRPDLFAAIGEREIDPLSRFIAIVRWTLSKDLRFVRGRVCKPYNSALGEQFRCAWEVLPASAREFAVFHDIYTGPNDGEAASTSASASASPAPSINRSDLPKSMSTLSLNDTSSPAGKARAGSLNGTASGASSLINAEGTAKSIPSESCKVAFLNEQVCHHPPISAFWYESTSTSKLAGVRATGIDQIAARFNGTSVKIGPGSQNKGIFVTIPEISKDEYQITHPGGYVTGFLSRAPYVTLSDTTFINTLSKGDDSKGKVYRAIINYPDESWISKPKFLVEGVVYETDSSTPEYTQVKKVPEAAVVARIKGSWRGKITIKRTNDKTDTTLLDVAKLDIVPKSVRELEKQDPMESRKFWEPVTIAINKRDYRQATAQKQAIEQAQRDKAAERAKTGDEFVPVFFDADITTGRAKLTGKGQTAVDEELQLKDHPR